ncbi:MAG: RIP metalloprotease RseP [Bacteriovoracaceae bacterium]|nr:RIP metalloprotease RseP [Bacteriovoracaceae bacterium]
MFIEKFGIFILFLGPLVFFHELGHFIFARLFGVRVETFSIGFGPKILKFKKGDTEYAVSLIPLGGYVKMFGDDPLNKDAIPVEERPFSFTFKGKWARFWIVMGGPLANFIMAYVIFMTLLVMGERLPELKLGVIPKTSTFYDLGLRSGDVIQKVNNKEVYNPTDILLEGEDLIKTMVVGRVEKNITLTLNLTGETFFEEFAKYPPTLRQPILVDTQGQTYALSLMSGKINWNTSYDQLRQTWDNEQPVYVYPLSVDEKNAEDPFVVNFEKEKTLSLKAYKNLDIGLSDNGFKTVDLMVKSINMKSPADLAGIKAGDVIYSLEGEDVHSFEDLRGNLQKSKSEKVAISLWRKGIAKNFEIVPEVLNQDGEAVKLIGVYSGGIFQPLKFIETKSKGFFEASLMALGRTWDTIVKTIDGFKKLITAEVSFKTIGGPLAIGKVASDSFNTSLSYFFQLMALISVNLGVINLFPIPVLDGGHIMFIFLEILNGGPVSRRKMEIAQQVGLSLLLMLMVGAIFNDFSRFF